MMLFLKFALGFSTAFYVAGMIVSLAFGIVGVMFECENGRDNPDFQRAKFLLKYFAVWPFGIYKYVKTQLSKQSEVKEGEEK